MQKIQNQKLKKIAFYLVALKEKKSDPKKFLKQVAYVNESFSYMLSEIQKECPQIKEVLQGANIQWNDNGLHYKKWKSSPYAYQRISSHNHKKGECFAISHMVFWLDEKNNTHFQIESTPCKGFFNTLLHFFDYVNYLLSNKQQGLTGNSIHTERKPLFFNKIL